MEVFPTLVSQLFHNPGSSVLRVFFRGRDCLVLGVEKVPEAVVRVRRNLGLVGGGSGRREAIDSHTSLRT